MMTSRLGFCALLMLSAMGSTASRATADTVPAPDVPIVNSEQFLYDGRVLLVATPPRGHCLIDGDRPLEKLMLRMFETTVADIGPIVGLSINCDWLENPTGFQMNDDDPPVYLVAIPIHDLGVPVMVDYGRLAYLEALAEYLSGDAAEAAYAESEAEADRHFDAWEAKAEAMLKQTVDFEGSRILGTIDRDPYAIYIASVTGATIGTRRILYGAVTASTVINGIAVDLEALTIIEDHEDFAPILAASRRYVRYLVEINEHPL